MYNNNYIQEAKEHFKKNGNKEYYSGDKISTKSQEIDKNLKNILCDKLKEDKNIKLNLKTSKWYEYGKKLKILANNMWYRAYYKDFGKNYPVVFGVSINKDGLSFSIQIYNKALKNLNESRKLGEIITTFVEKLEIKFERIKRDRDKEKYFDYGYTKLDSFDDKKFREVLEAYKKIAQKVQKYIKLNNENKYILIDSYEKYQEDFDKKVQDIIDSNKSDEQLLKETSSPNYPNKTNVSTTVYERSAKVVAFVLKRANGICECCEKEAPFKNPNGKPYLEVHHIIKLSDGGSDDSNNAEALCPNCHREKHFGIKYNPKV